MNVLILTNPTVGGYGYSIVAKRVCRAVRELGHTPYVLSTLLIGNLIKDDEGNANLPPFFGVYGKQAMREYIKGLDIGLMITIFDCWDPKSHDIPDIVHKFKIPLISHVTTRSYPLSPHWNTFLYRTDAIVTPTMWGKSIVEELFPGRTSYIQHGVDLDTFKPDKKARTELRKRMGYEDKFVFLAVGRNKEMQKRYPRLLKAFKAFLRNVPQVRDKVVLHIHACEKEAYDLDEMRNMGFQDISQDHVKFSRVKFNGEKLELCKEDDEKGMRLNPNWGLDANEMAKMYNMADCFVHAGEGESFCLPCIEAQACGLPSVVPNHSAFKEIVGKPETGLLSKISTEETTPTLTDVQLIDMVDMAKGLYKIYNDDELRKKCSENALNNAKKYDWEIAVDKWKFIIKKMLEPKIDYQKGLLGV